MSPRHDFRCRSCGRTFELRTAHVEGQLSPCCGTAAEWIPQVHVEVFRGFWHHDLGPDPIYIESKEHYREELKRTGHRLRHSTKSGVGV